MDLKVSELSCNHGPLKLNKICHHFHSHGKKSKVLLKNNDSNSAVENELSENYFQVKKCQSERILPSLERSEAKLKVLQNHRRHNLIVKKTPSSVSIVGTTPPRIYIVDARKNKNAKPINISEITNRRSNLNWLNVLIVIFVVHVVLLFFSIDFQNACGRYNRGASYKRLGIKYYICHIINMFRGVNIFI